jgi:ribonuclease P protein component
MMPDIRRLKTRREFLRVAAARRKRVRPGLIVQAARRTASLSRPASPPAGQEHDGASACPAEPAARVGFTASRKVGNAVARNRARRRLRAVAAEVLPAVAEAGTDYVLVARKATLVRSYGDLVRDLHQALIQLGYEGKENHRVPRPRRKGPPGPRASAPGDRR